MSRKSENQLNPRNGHTLVVGIVCRISGCANQKEASLEDQEDNAKEAIAELYDGPVEFRVITTIGKGEALDRPELEQIEFAYRSREFDAFVYDDLSRLIRGGEAARLLGVGVDHGTRSICIDDGIDTVDETWEEDALNACSENVAHNQRTSKRIKQKMMNRFKKHGETARRSIYGYSVPAGAKSFVDWQKDPIAEKHILEGARILRATRNGAAVADYFNANNVPVGPYARNDQWDGTMVLRYYRNPLLKGMPYRGRMATVKHHGSGKRVSKKNPDGPTYYDAPHLAYFEPAEHDDLVALLATSNERFRRKAVNGADPRANVPRKRTRFPGQHARCWYCGRQFTWGGNGMKGHLMCSGSHKYHCWNSIHIDGALVTDRVRSAITEMLYQQDGFDDQFRAIVEVAQHGAQGNGGVQLKQLVAEEVQLGREKDNLLAAIKALGTKQMILDEVEAIEERGRELARRRYLIEKSQKQPLELPRSVDELRAQLAEQFQALSVESPEFGMLLRQIVPEIDVYLVRLLDGGHPLPRARVKICFSGIMPSLARVAGLDEMLTRVTTLDLFDPPQRERIRLESVRLEAAGLEQRQIAQQIEEHPKQAAVFNALALHRQMLSQGLSSPYVMLREPPSDYSKLRRYHNRRYRFTPLEGYAPAEL